MAHGLKCIGIVRKEFNYVAVNALEHARMYTGVRVEYMYSMLRNLIDRLQIWLYLGGNTELAHFIGRWGTEAQIIPGVPDSERITIPDPEEVLDPDAPLQLLNFDDTFRTSNKGIDVAKDLAFPTHKYDIN